MACAAPPEHGRFKKGQSGNPKRRPKKQVDSPVASAFDIVIERKLTVMQAGTPREMTLDEALEQRTYQAALAGNRMAQREVFAMIARHEKARQRRSPAKRPKIDVLVEEANPRTANLAVQLLGIAAINPARGDWEKPGVPSAAGAMGGPGSFVAA